MSIYKSKIKRLPGTNYSEIHSDVRKIYKKIISKSKRRAYIRSKYFKGQKVFLTYFWQHIFDKRIEDRVRRLKQYPCAIDLIKYTTTKPISKINPENNIEMLHRFTGVNGNNETFCVQIKENLKTHEKSFISAFPL